MRNLFSSLFAVLSILLLSACDLQPKIVGALGMDGDRNSAPAAEASASDYGAPAGDLYGAREPEYASANDYAPPPAPKEPPAPESPKPKADSPKPPADSQKPAAPPPPPAVEEPDDILLVPARVAAAKARPTVVAPESGEVSVEKGDTLYSISQKYNVPLRDLVEENKLAPPYALAVGQKLKLPGTKYHSVAQGETLYSISRMYSVDLNSLARANNIAAPYGLAVGQKLRLPASVGARSAAVRVAVADSAAAAKPEIPKPEIAKPKAEPDDKKAPAVAAPAPKQSSAPVGKLPAAAGRTSTKFSWPVQGRILSNFGAKKNGLYNDGINIGAPKGASVKAAENGVVAYAGNELKGMGNLVIIQHSGGWMTVYAHLDAMNVKRGSKVAVGEKIGTVGSTGKVGEPQLHFEIRNGTRAYNPATQLKK